MPTSRTPVKKKPPTTIKVGPFPYRVVFEEGNFKDVDHPDEVLHGLIDTDIQTIRVSGSLAPEMQQETLLHEILHGLFHLVGLSDKLNQKKEEDIIRVLSPALLHTLQANPKLRDYLLQEKSV